MVFLTENM